MSLTLHEGGADFDRDPRFIDLRARLGSLEIRYRTSTYLPDRHSYETTGAKDEMISSGLCPAEWFPQGLKRVSYIRTNGPVLILRRLKGGIYKFLDLNPVEAREQIYKDAFAGGHPLRPHLRLVWSAPGEGK